MYGKSGYLNQKKSGIREEMSKIRNQGEDP
jgi:hypothetical protein